MANDPHAKHPSDGDAPEPHHGASESYPHLIERALRLIDERAGPVGEAELVARLFGVGGPGGPWRLLLGRVLGADARLRRDDAGRWGVAPVRERAAREAGDGPYRPRGEPAGPRRDHPPEAPTAIVASEGGSIGRTEPIAEPRAASAGPAAPVGLVVLAAGPKPWRHPIVALGAARPGADGRVGLFETLVRPARPCRVPAYLARYGVTASQLDEAPSLAEALEALLAFVGDRPLAGLDIGVAVAHLQFALRELGRPPLGNPTLELAVAGEARPDLERLARARGLPLPTPPRPGGLAGLAARLAAGRAAAGSGIDATAWRRLLDARALADVPDAPGVYLFRNRAGRLLYVGKAASLRSRLASYLAGNVKLTRAMAGLVAATERIEREEWPCELAARLREAQLIAAERPPYNVQRAYGPALAWARLVLAGEIDPTGARVPRLALELSDGPGDAAALGSVAAARGALARARAAWWPARPRAAERPPDRAVCARLERLAGELARAVGGAEVAPGLRGADLGALLVVAPVRPRGGVRVAPEVLEIEEWPPPDVSWREDDPRAVEDPSPDEDEWAGDAGPAEELAALLVGPGGMRRACRLPWDVAELEGEGLRRRAVAELERGEDSSGNDGIGGLAALRVLAAALRRGEPGVCAWAIEVRDSTEAPGVTLG